MKTGLMLLAAATALAACGELRNGDFEQVDEKGRPAGWWIAPPARYGRTFGSNGSAGVVYEHAAEGPFKGHCGQRMPVEPGVVYAFGAFVKAENVRGTGPCFVCVGFHDKDGKWLGESRSVACRRDTEGAWVKLDGVTRQTPTNAAWCSMGFHVDHRLLGTFSFDKAYFDRMVLRPVAALYSSAYHDEACDGTVRFAAALSPNAFPCAAAELKAVFTLRGADGAVAERPGAFEDGASVAALELPVAELSPGTNEVVCALRRGTNEIGRAEMRFVRRNAPAKRRVAFDRHGRLLVAGRPFFPYGMYTGRGFFDETNLARFCEAPFNVYMQYGQPKPEELDRAYRRGLMCLYNVSGWYHHADKGTNSVAWLVKRVRNHPAVLAWYLFDELPVAQAPIARDRYRFIRTLDEEHPQWCVQDAPGELRAYLGCVDAVGCDPYPISTRPASLAGEWIEEATRQAMGVRPFIEVVQSFSWGWHDAKQAHQRRPNEGELRSMTWQALAGGARGIVYYAYGYLERADVLGGEPTASVWADLVKVAQEVRAYERVLLLAETKAIAKKDLPAGVMGRVFSENGETWKMLVNTTPRAVESVQLPAYGFSFVRVR